MKRKLALLLLSFLLVVLAWGQAPPGKLHIRVALVDNDLNVKPVPKLALVFHPLSETPAPDVTISTNFEGLAQVELPAGRYRLSTPQLVTFQGQRYAWDLEVRVSQSEETLELSSDNASKSTTATTPTPASSDDLNRQFQRLGPSVVHVWSEFGQATGFLVDSAGLILTNYHVIARSEINAVQFDDRRKVAADVVVSDPQADVAVLRVNLSVYPEAVIAPLAAEGTRVVEGDRVFTIGDPLRYRRILTTGIISRVHAHVLTSDITINPGNSGGPLFNSAGQVIGITTFRHAVPSSPGLSGIVSVDDARPLLARARESAAGKAPLAAALLPVPPTVVFPREPLRAAFEEGKIDPRHYQFDMGNFHVTVVTPVLSYYKANERALLAAKQKEKRMHSTSEEQLLSESLYNQPSYSSQYHPVTIISVVPKIDNGFFTGKVWFKADFLKMRLLCGGNEVVPMHPYKSRRSINVRTTTGISADTTTAGYYFYLHDAISPLCGEVKLEIYSEEKPNQPIARVLDSKLVERVWSDFEPYRKSQPKP